jgi:chemotaxis protein methyltransferase CheR
MQLSEMPKPVPAISTATQVTDAQLARYAELIYHRTGIRVSPHKKMLLSNRLRRRLRDTGIKDFEEYFKHLQKLRSNAPEWDAFLQEITTHETYLFRDEAQWDWLCKDFLPNASKHAKQAFGKQSLRIWSAACSTGDEPFTIACCVNACLPDLPKWNVQILATDIGVGALDQARSAVFGERAMRLVPDDYTKRFFTKAKDANIWQAKPALSSMISFRQHNLLETVREPAFDLVLLKNVLIYFDATSKKTVMDNVREAIRPGGLLLAGAAEGIADLVKDFIRIQPWLYRRPESA